MLRNQVKAAGDAIVKRIADIKRVKAGGVDVELERQVKGLAASTAAAEEQVRSKSPRGLAENAIEAIPLPPETPEERLTKYQQLAVLDPRAAILLPFADMERVVRKRFREMYPKERHPLNFTRITSILHRDGFLSDEIASALREMTQIRNQAAHEATALDMDIANFFLDAVGNVLGYLALNDFFGSPEPKP